MKTISVQELRERTEHWVRQVAEGEELVITITERGRPIARMLPSARIEKANPFPVRKLLPGVARLLDRPLRGPSSTEIISQGRDGR